MIAGVAAGAMFVPLALRREPEFLTQQGGPALAATLLLVGSWFVSLLAVLGFVQERLRAGKSSSAGLAGGVLGVLVSMGLGVLAVIWGQRWMTVLPLVAAGVCVGMAYGFRRESGILSGVPRVNTGARDGELFKKFPQAARFEELGFGPTPLGEVGVVVVYYERAVGAKVTVVAELPRSLNFGLNIRVREGGGALTGDFDKDLSIHSDDERSRAALLQADELRRTILKFLKTTSGAAEIDSGQIRADLPAVERAADLPGSILGEAAVLAYQLSARAQQLGLTSPA